MGSSPPPDFEDARARLMRRAIWLPLLLVALAHANAVFGTFVWDDHSLIEEQALVRVLAPLPDYFTRMFWSDSMSVSSGYYRPLVTLGYAVEYALWGGAAEGFHLTNLLLHLGVVAWVFLLCRRGGASPLGAAVGAAAFGLFPRLTESVAWISGRTDVLAAFFMLAALLVYQSTQARRRWLSGGLLLLGLLCKEVAVAGILGLAVWELRAVRARERTGGQALRNLLPMAVALAAYAVLRLNALRSDVRALDGGVSAGLSLGERALAALAAVGHYAVMMVDALRPRLQMGVVGEAPLPWVLLGATVLVAGVLLAWRWGGRLSALSQAALASGALALALVLHLIPLGIHTLASDRFLYVPVAMLAIALAAPIEHAARARPKFAGAVAGGVLVAFAGATHLRNRDWMDEMRLWRVAERVSGPEDAFIQQQLGGLYMNVHRYDDALVHLQNSVRTQSRLTGAKGYNNLALCLTKLGRHEEAITLFEEMVKQQPGYHRGHLNLAMTLARAGRFDAALLRLQELQALTPGDTVIPELRALFERARDTVAKLPTKRPGGEEPAAVAEARARMYQELGAPHEAATSWEAVLSAPDATPEQRMHAVGFLVFEGNLGRARAALDGMRRAQPGDERLILLEEALASRSSLDLSRME
ncbi:tetratricopeptide repeat protein [Myxococcus landrumensis]|uniref:Tetratricopeptide repeat protein n=1 Tax=Myxococcus landrumensis TaxID=2813577 RepID=A0ABX7N8V8_9BACT|nr:tetratricopeptide repeat protein [Myxococcus landrumus]QSQ13984.1 tetratricopeptide repeat protein [Myxococcus landrumus]